MTDFSDLLLELDHWHTAGRTASFWLRDDDAIQPTPALDRLLDLGKRHTVPLTLAVIPADTGPELAKRLENAGQIEVAVHGWAHTNYAPQGQKSRELGPDRPADAVLGDLSKGMIKLQKLYEARFIPLLVPPWNRLDASLVPHLSALGFLGVSVFGPEPPNPPLPTLNTHVDLIDWHGNRGGRPGTVLVAEMVVRLRQMAVSGGALGLLTHHLVHDDPAWAFLDAVMAATSAHPSCRWQAASALLKAGQTSVT